MKKILLIVMLTLILSACGQQVNMDEQAKDGNYHYENRDFGFMVTLPPEFEYYQTQRIETSVYTDIEFFLPTKDPEFTEETFPSYFKPLVIRVWSDSLYPTLSEEQKSGFSSFGNKNNQEYSYKFTTRIPSDWTERWSEDIKQFIIDNLELK